MDRDTLIETLAQVLAGLQAPLSLGGGLLGTADAPLRQVLMDSGFGWRTAEEFETYLRERLS